jgi:hypothetical protein
MGTDGKHKGWMLIKASEDGKPTTVLKPHELDDLLRNPINWGVTGFAELDGLPDDPNYWPAKVGVLVRFETVIPQPAGIYRLPDWVHE